MRILGRGPSARRALAEQRRRASVDSTPTLDRSPQSWWRREIARAEAQRGSLPVDATSVAVNRATMNRAAVDSVSVDSVSVDGVSVDGVAVVCATNRPTHAETVIANIARQSIVGRIHAVIVLNDPGVDADMIMRGLEAAGCARVSVLSVPPEGTLGECLRRGLAATDARYLAKFDDDDVYGARHVEDSIAALRWSGAAVAGKQSYLVYLDDVGETVLRFPDREWRFVGFVAGGTIVMDRQRTRSAAFGEGDVGEDSAFLAAVERAGGLILATSALGYVQYRDASPAANTWSLDPDQVRRDSVSLGHGDLRSLLVADSA